MLPSFSTSLLLASFSLPAVAAPLPLPDLSCQGSFSSWQSTEKTALHRQTLQWSHEERRYVDIHGNAPAWLAREPYVRLDTISVTPLNNNGYLVKFGLLEDKKTLDSEEMFLNVPRASKWQPSRFVLAGATYANPEHLFLVECQVLDSHGAKSRLKKAAVSLKGLCEKEAAKFCGKPGQLARCQETLYDLANRLTRDLYEEDSGSCFEALRKI